MKQDEYYELNVSAEDFGEEVYNGAESQRALARTVTERLQDRKRKRGGPDIKCSHEVISKLARGDAKTITKYRALEIERALGVGRGTLFVKRVA